MIPESFHFLRPAWLLALAPVALLVWTGLHAATRASAWRRAVDAHLLRHLMLTDGGAARRWPLALAGGALAAACVALAGPAWERVPQPTFSTSQPVVVALDMSPTMTASDVRPSRLARARHKLHDLLARTRGGQVGLVLYTDEAFVAAPLTDDARVIDEMVPSLESGLMPLRPGRADRAIAQATALLEQAGAASGDILLLTDGVDEHADAALATARAAAASGHAVSVLGVGEPAGLDADGLAQLAEAGGGRFAALSAGDADLTALLPAGAQPAATAAAAASSAQADVWRDAGVYLVLIPLLLAPLAFRRGLVAAIALALLAAAPARAEASLWSDLWSRRDQQAQAALEAGDPARAAALFEDPEWKAAAQYQSGRFADSVAAYRELPGNGNVYNLGNALARAGKLEDAIAAYDEVLASVPDHADARFNRDLVQKLLDQQRQQQQGQQGQQQDQDSQGDAGQQDGQGAEQQHAAQQPQGGDQQQQDEDRTQPGDGTSENEQASPAAAPEAGSRTADAAGSEPSGEQLAQQSQPQQQPAPGQQPEKQASAPAQPSADGASRDESAAQNDAERSRQNEQAERDRSLAERLTHALQDAGADEPEDAAEHDQAGQDGAARADASRPMSEREQARAQALRAIPDDPGGLLRAKIRRHYAEKRYSQRQEMTPW